MQHQSRSTHHKFAPVATVAILAAAAFVFAPSANAQAPGGMGLVFQDEFTNANISAQPSSSNWGYDTGGGGWGNGELQIYTSNGDNAHEIYDGTGTDGQALQIKAVSSGGQWYSARLNSAGHKSFGPYGYFEARCKFPNAGKAYWPAFWMLGDNIGSVGWPSCGEIDIAEEINGQWQNHQSLHMPGWDPTLVTTPNSSTTTYHNYGANWQPGYVAFYVDGQYTGQFNQGGGGSWVFNGNPMHILLNCAVGGVNNFPGYPDGSTQSVGYFDVDYVKVYENGAPTIPNGRYEIVASTTGNVLDAWGASNANQTPIKCGTWNGGANQLWQVTNLGNGYYSIISSQGGNESLDCTGCSANNNTVIELWPYWGGSCQQWGINQTGGGIWSISTASVAAQGGHDVLDGSGCSGANGTQVILWQWGGGGCQQNWVFVPR